MVLMPSSPLRAEPSGGKQQRSPVNFARNHACPPLLRGKRVRPAAARVTLERRGPTHKL